MNRRIKNFGLIIFLLAVISAVIWGAPFDRPSHNDEAIIRSSPAMLILEKGILARKELTNYTVDRVLYDVFLAGVYGVFGPYPAAAQVINVLLFACLAVLVYKLAQLIFSERIARLAGFTTALCYTLASYTSWVAREVFFVVLVVLLVYCLYRAQQEKKWGWFLAGGAVFGAALLTNSVIQYFLPIVFVNFLFINKRSVVKHIWPKLACFLVACFVAAAPISIIDYINSERTFLLSEQGFVLAMRAEKMQNIKDSYFQHLVANATGDLVAQKLFSDYDRSEARFGWQVKDEYWAMLDRHEDKKEIDQQYTREAVKEIVRHPILFLQMSSIDFLKFNTPMVPNIRMQHMFAETDTHPELSDTIKIAVILGIRLVYLIMGILIVLAMVKKIRDWHRVGWLVLIILYFNLIFSAVHAIARYSLPIYPFYIIFLAVGALMVWDKLVAVIEKKSYAKNFPPKR